MSKILIIEDEDNIRNLYRDELIDEGYEVITAEDGKEGFNQFKNNQPDLITIDIKMKGMDGIELMHKIRKIDKNIPIILYTAYGEYSQDFATWAADEYLVKSSDLKELKDKIRKMVS